MTETPPVDVVIATHRRPEMVREAIDAVRRQTYAGPVRVHVVHDRCEPDASLATVDGPPERRVEVLVNTRTPGLAGSRNTGTAAGSAPLVAFCDDDDLWHPDKLERQVDVLLRRGWTTSVTGIVVDHQGTSTVRVPTWEDLSVEHLLRHRVVAAHPSTVLVRRDALERIGPVDEQIPGSFGEDYVWILRAAADEGGVEVLSQPLVTVRWGGSQFARDWDTIVAALDYLLAKHPGFHEDPKALARVRGQQAFALAALGRRREALRVVGDTLRSSRSERRAYVAGAVALGLPAGRVLDAANRLGRGI